MAEKPVIESKHQPRPGPAHCDGAVAEGRLELRPPMESSDLDEKVLTTTLVRDTSILRIRVEVYVASVTSFHLLAES